MTFRSSMIAILTATTLTAGAASAKVKTEATEDFDIRNYGTYSWATEDATETAANEPLCGVVAQEATTSETAGSETAVPESSVSESAEARDAAKTRLQDDLDRRLAALGIERVESGGDLTVRIDGGTYEETRVQVTDVTPWVYDRHTIRRPWARAYGWHFTTFPDSQLALIDTYETTRGALSLELVDSADGETVWRGEAEGRVRASEAKNAKKLDKALDKMFRDVMAQAEATTR